MKNLLILFLCSALPISAEAPIETFLNKYSDPIYQDLVIGNEIFPLGSDLCESRYHLIKPILGLYNKPFSVLDLGAAQGYFSFRIANDYPQSMCVMVEANDTSYYAHHGDMLFDLCQFNSHLSNIIYLKRRMDLSDLSFLNEKEHFDVIIAFLVVHLMEETLQKQIDILESLLSLSDNLIIEVANDVGVIHTAYVEYLSHKLECHYLGEVKRHKNPRSTSTGKLFWFKRKNAVSKEKEDPMVVIQADTFTQLNGVYPENFPQVSN